MFALLFKGICYIVMFMKTPSNRFVKDLKALPDIMRHRFNRSPALGTVVLMKIPQKIGRGQDNLTVALHEIFSEEFYKSKLEVMDQIEVVPT